MLQTVITVTTFQKAFLIHIYKHRVVEVAASSTLRSLSPKRLLRSFRAKTLLRKVSCGSRGKSFAGVSMVLRALYYTTVTGNVSSRYNPFHPKYT